MTGFCVSSPLKIKRRIRKDVCHAAFFGDTAFVNDSHAVADLVDDLHLVCNDDDRHAERLVDLAQQFENGARCVGVEGAGRFVAQQISGIGCQCAGDGNALLLSAGKLRGEACSLVSKAHDLQKFLRALLCLRLRRTGDLKREADVAQNRALLKQIEALEDHTDLTANLQKFLLAERRQIPTVYPDLSGGRALEQVDAAHERRLACAGKTDDAEDLAVRDSQIHILQRFHAAGGRGIDFAEVFQLDHGKSPSTVF